MARNSESILLGSIVFLTLFFLGIFDIEFLRHEQSRRNKYGINFLEDKEDYYFSVEDDIVVQGRYFFEQKETKPVPESEIKTQIESDPPFVARPLNHVPPTVCVDRKTHKQANGIVTQSGCNFEPCTKPKIHRQLPEYGFVRYLEPGYRGRVMVVPGSAKDGAGCAISHKYKFIYIHVLKSGGSSIKDFLRVALCSESEQTDPKCMIDQPEKKLAIVNCGTAIKKYGHSYFVWSFVRNPFARLFSGYAMAASGSFTKVKTPLEFERFAMANNVERQQLSRTHRSHYFPQTYFLFNGFKSAQGGCPVFDFLGRLEKFDRDMSVVLDRINSPELNRLYYIVQNGTMIRNGGTSYGHKKMVKDPNDKNNSSGILKNAYRNETVRKAVIHEYSLDFYLLGYSPDMIPSK